MHSSVYYNTPLISHFFFVVKGYNSPVYNKTDYHYGSDFGDSSEKSEDEIAMSASDSPESVANESDSDFSLSSYSNVSRGGGPSSSQNRSTTPDPIWLKDDVDIPPLELPNSSDDLLVPKKYVLRAVGIYEILRRYRNLVRLSPFRLEDFCGALICDEQSTLLTEIHIALLKAILREEDSQQTHFGPLDQKDSINISLYLLDSVTWPEVLRNYVESDPSFDKNVLSILSTKEYPYTEIDDRLDVLQLLTDQFLTTTSVRDDMIQEGPIHYDDHCRICHRLGDLLCCETCPAVFHLDCVDPPLTDVPSEDWQCNICKSHSVSGVVDCVSSVEKQGLLCRHEHYGFDRHARKYWFVCRRLFIETEDGTELWYYSTEAQFENVVSKLDAEDMEKQLCKEITDFKEEIVKQMQLTESITTEEKGNKKSYFENEHGKMQKELKDTENDTENATDGENNNEAMADVEENLDATEIDKTEGQQHLTRSRTNQITNGTYFFKLGMENSFKTYSNQFTFNPVALNKPQKNEERDKKRHLSHKFSLTQASEFKWGGLLNGTQSSLIAVFKQTLLTFESAISSPYMHCNWTKLRKLWLNAVAASTTPQDFAKLLIVLETSFKSVTFANVWHEHLGHTKLYRITSGEREERKKSEKREKREGDEEERHRLAYNFVKYSLGLKHQVWKQKGEEYRIHGQWGWLWSSRSRRNKIWNNIYRQRIQYVNVVITHETKDKVISLKRQTFENLNKILELNSDKGMETDEADDQNCAILRGIEVVKDQKQQFESIDVSQALNAKTRVVFPKVAKKSTLDDLLERREKLRDVELKIKESTDNNGEIPENIIQTAENHKKKFVGSTQCIQKILQDIIDSKTKINQKTKHSEVSEKCQEIHNLRTEMQYVTDILKKHKCYSRNCRNGSTPINLQSFSLCYSNLCLKETQIKKKIALLIQQLKERYSIMGKKQSILHQKLTEAKNNDLLDILHKYQLWDYMNDEYFQYDLTTCKEDLSAALTEAIDYDAEFITPFAIKSELIETKMEVEETNEPKVKKDEDDDDDEDEEMKDEKPEYVNRPNRRFTNIVRPKKEIEFEKELDAEGNEKVFATTSPQGKVYLKRVEKVVKDATVIQPNGTATTSTTTTTTTTVSTTLKYPAITTFSTVKQTRNILILPKYELIRVARRSGRIYVDGFNHQAKNNTSVWPYPCSRPLFKTCWTYRSFCVTSFASLALQLRIIWTCMRWDDMATKPATTDGKNQITSESEILTTELLKHRNVGSFMEKTQYFRRKIVIPLELPKTIREVQSIRSGLRKRKRAESPQQTEPQVTEEWVDEDKLELWEIKQYGEK